MAAVMKPDRKLQDDASENESSNPSSTKTFREIAAEHLSRRNVLQGSLAVAAAGYLAPASAYADDDDDDDRGRRRRKRRKKELLDFEALSKDDAIARGMDGQMVTVSTDYEYDVLIPWGTPINPNLGILPYEGDPNSRPSSADQENMIGIGHDGMWFFPANLRRVLRVEQRRGRQLPAKARRRVLSNRLGILCINHEFGNNFHVIGKAAPESLEDVRLSQAAHGVSVVAIGKHWNGKWDIVPSSKNRRITVNTPMDVSGPAADSELLKNAAGNLVAGTVNNCGSGPTPWGTYVTCEENFNLYFGSTEFAGDGDNSRFNAALDEIINDPASLPADRRRAEALKRYGFDRDGAGYNWFEFDPRFDLSNPDYANESNRFGWCVEIDPFNPHKKPVKRTAMGRFKHEAAAFKELDDGRVAVYMGDDQRGDYCYKFESNYPWRHAIAMGASPLDDGKLYVARFHDDNRLDGSGSGDWVELTIENNLIRNAGFTSQAEVLVYARMAADAVFATPMDRPEWSTIGKKGQVYWTLTNNDRKDDGQGAVSEVNPVFENEDGYIISTRDKSTTQFEWDMFIIARNTRRPDDPDPNFKSSPEDLDYAAYTEPADGGANVFTDPDAAYADPFDRLYIGTDGGQPDGLQDQLVVFDTRSGEYRRLLMGVNSDEITGITFTPDHRTLFTNTQHPGNGDPSATSFPAPPGSGRIPRDCTLVVTRKRGYEYDDDDDDDDDEDDDD